MTLGNLSATLSITPYARISETDEERAPGIDRQLRIVHPLIHQHGVATPEYVDNNKSAFDPDVYRDNFERWLKDFEGDATDGIAAYHLDRVCRQPMDLERIISAYMKRYKRDGRKGIFLFPSGSIDLTNSDGQLFARMLVNMANKSSSDDVRRLSDFFRDEALKGRVLSNRPAFYRNADGSINEAKAATARKAIADVLSGVRPITIAEEWRAAGITTAHGGHLRGETVRRILMSPGIAGIAVYKGEALRDTDGKYIKRIDGGLVDEATWLSLCDKLKVEPRRHRRTKALLSRVLRCGRCGSHMVRCRRFIAGKERFYYGCMSKDSGGCGGVSIAGIRLDQQITEMVLEYLNRPVQPTKDEPFSGQPRLDEVTAKISELMEAYNTGELGGSVVFPQIKKLEDEQRTLQRAAGKHERSRHKITTVADEWPDIGLDRQQAIIDTLFESIVIQPARYKKDPDRVQVIWRDITPEQVLARLSVLLGGKKSLVLAA